MRFRQLKNCPFTLLVGVAAKDCLVEWRSEVATTLFQLGGFAVLTAAEAACIQVVELGAKEDADEGIWRVKWYCGLALFNEQGLAPADGVTN